MNLDALPGPGDAATWGPCNSPRDPRWTDDDEVTPGDQVEAMREARDYVGLAETALVQKNFKRYHEHLQSALEILQSLSGSNE
jgi:hypothetical protein